MFYHVRLGQVITYFFMLGQVTSV